MVQTDGRAAFGSEHTRRVAGIGVRRAGGLAWAMDRPPGGRAWPLAITVLGVAAMLVVAAVYLLKRASDVPREVAEQGRRALQDLRSIAEAFRTGTVVTSFTSYATEVSGSAYLQFATLKQVEVFERKDTATVLWGRLALPDVVVVARAPVTYTYYLDLNERWTFRLEGATVLATAPPIQFNEPAIDASAIRFEVREGSVLRDEGLALEGLKAGLTEMARIRARQNLPLVREVGRRKTEEFVERWLSGFRDGRSYRARVVFSDEAPSAAPSAGDRR
jgi:hypothetical protein